MTRREQREAVFQLLFETEFKKDERPEEIFALAVEDREITVESESYIKNVYFSTLAELNYTGVPASSSKTTYSSTSVSTALSTTVVESYTHSNSHSTHVGVGFEEKVNAKFPFVGGGELMHRGTTEEIFPLIIADTLGSCPVMKKEAKA